MRITSAPDPKSCPGDRSCRCVDRGDLQAEACFEHVRNKGGADGVLARAQTRAGIWVGSTSLKAIPLAFALAALALACDSSSPPAAEGDQDAGADTDDGGELTRDVVDDDVQGDAQRDARDDVPEDVGEGDVPDTCPCQGEQLCVDDRCVDPCATDDDCEGDQICDAQSGLCGAPECVDEGAQGVCEAGMACLMGRCTWVSPDWLGGMCAACGRMESERYRLVGVVAPADIAGPDGTSSRYRVQYGTISVVRE